MIRSWARRDVPSLPGCEIGAETSLARTYVLEWSCLDGKDDGRRYWLAKAPSATLSCGKSNSVGSMGTALTSG